VQILFSSQLLDKKLVKTKDSVNKQHYDLTIYNASLVSKISTFKLFTLPTKLPMIVAPKAYELNYLAGYISNDIDYTERLIINKTGLGKGSEVSSKNNLYELVNNVARTPFKINTVLLDFIMSDDRFSLLMNPSVEHEYACIKRTRVQVIRYKPYNSKLLCQEIVLDIVNFYKNYNKKYFPVRLDNRGRLNCLPNYFHYQSDELSKALILFSNPGKISKTGYNSYIDY